MQAESSAVCSNGTCHLKDDGIEPGNNTEISEFQNDSTNQSLECRNVPEATSQYGVHLELEELISCLDIDELNETNPETEQKSGDSESRMPFLCYSGNNDSEGFSTCRISSVESCRLTLPVINDFIHSNGSFNECKESDKHSTTDSIVNLKMVAFEDDKSIVQNDINILDDDKSSILSVLEEACQNCIDIAEINQASFDDIINILPQEILLKIFSYLTPKELCLHVAPVSKAWYRYAYDPVLWKHLDFRHNASISSVDLCWILRRTPHLKSLVIPGRTSSLGEVCVISESCKELEHLNIGFWTNLSGSFLKCFLQNCLNLQSLNIEGCGNIQDSNCVKVLAAFKKLHMLNVSHCTLLDKELEYLAKKLNCITSLNIDGIPWITGIGIKKLLQLHKDNLVDLYLDGAEMTDQDMELVLKCPKLQTLTISFCDLLTDLTLQHLQNIQYGCLGKLMLRKGLNFSDQALRDMFLTSSLSKLYHLDLSECSQLRDDGLLQIGKCCGKSLHHLALCWCWAITDTGLIHIVDHCGNLEYLDLLGIDKVIGICLHRIPDEMPRLTYLNLRQCNKIDDDLIVEIIRQKPDLTGYMVLLL
ncbi:hypothetical protein CHS0354_039901 [Potamilus streckersoni]|uniref:F-box domain-containing protein n=1 Tax=Potamilus streckersoni TaxID=2493646 RepID=A0AAE0TH51_9BIVA|nr:hypothetical protein CHS0354_039901 [Potamilus streckersoni]